MGYTHYWKTPKGLGDPTKWEAFTTDARQIIANAEIPLGNWEGIDEPEITDSFVGFNGRGDDGHESFILERKPLAFCFCKTNMKPYDTVVCAVLICAKHHFGEDIRITSDGTREDWESGRILFSNVTGYGLDFKLDAWNI